MNTGLSNQDINFFAETMHAMEIHHKRLRIKGFLIDCPAGRPLDNCPAGEIRELPLKERTGIVDEMKADEVESIYKQHEECLSKR